MLSIAISCALSAFLALPLQVTPTGVQGRALKGAALGPQRPNLVVVLADDFGVDLVGAYGEGAAPPCTPHLDQIAAEGMLFRNAWANPTCSPTRAALLTGRHAFRNGIGTPVTGPMSGLLVSETILPEMLTGYASSAIGKWHVSNVNVLAHPTQSGFDHFVGTIAGGVDDYSSWTKVENGTATVTSTYATSDVVDEAIAAIDAMPEPWLLYVAFHAPHSPFHLPPSELCPAPACPQTWCDTVSPQAPNVLLGKAMVEAMDREFGRLLNHIDGVAPDSVVVFMGDNGTAGQASQSPFLASHAKGTVYEGGLNVPLVVRGPGVVGGTESAALVSIVDVFATLADLAGVRAGTEDSVSFVPVLGNPALTVRDTVYSERFTPNHASLPIADHERAIRGERFKLIRRSGQPDEFYDLWADAFETANLLPSLTADQQLAHDALVARLVELGTD